MTYFKESTTRIHVGGDSAILHPILLRVAQYLGEKLAGDSSSPGLAFKAALLFEWGCSGVVSARFWEACIRNKQTNSCFKNTFVDAKAV